MQNNLRGKIRNFLASEEGRVGAKSPLTLGVASASVLLAHAVVATSAQAHTECSSDADCSEGERCSFSCAELSDGTCLEWHSRCTT